jgi:hypothetical protein
MLSCVVSLVDCVPVCGVLQVDQASGEDGMLNGIPPPPAARMETELLHPHRAALRVIAPSLRRVT